MPRSIARLTGLSVSSGARKALHIDGMEAIAARLAEIMDAPTSIEAKRVYAKAGFILRNRASANAPVSGVPPSPNPARETVRRKGMALQGTHLKDAMFVAYGRMYEPNVIVGVNFKKAPHAWMVEFNPNHQPYFRPAITQTASAVANEIRAGLLQVIVESGK